MQSQEYSLLIVLWTCASSTTHLPSTVQRTAQRRSFQTKYLMRSAFNFSFLPGVLIIRQGCTGRLFCKMLHVATVDSLLPPATISLDIPPSCYIQNRGVKLP